MKIIRIISRILAGMVFVFSGFVKAIDPLGSTYKFQDYFEAFHLEFLNGFAFPLAIILSTLELVIGLNLVIGIRVKLTSWLLLLFMTFFTILTFVLAISNPVSDCGCFGDAIKLTNWQTFWKNIIIFIPTIIVFWQRNRYTDLYAGHSEWALSISFVLLALLLSAYSYHNLPLMDFRPYSTGTHIPDKMVVPEGMQVDEYETILVYEKEGVRQEFTMENYPWQDTTWKWVETKQNLIKKGYEPPIHDFVISSEDGRDVTRDILNDPGYVFLIIAYDLSKTNRDAFKTINKAVEEGQARGFKYYLITSSVMEEITSFRESVRPACEIYTADEITLKTIIRANPGIVLLRQGTILGKWHHLNFRSQDFRGQNPDSVVLDKYRKSIEGLRVAVIAAGLMLLLCLFHMVYRKE
jgi:uncharacterized membrane protein YphA (DoxX/SURF4 family)